MRKFLSCLIFSTALLSAPFSARAGEPPNFAELHAHAPYNVCPLCGRTCGCSLTRPCGAVKRVAAPRPAQPSLRFESAGAGEGAGSGSGSGRRADTGEVDTGAVGGTSTVSFTPPSEAKPSAPTRRPLAPLLPAAPPPPSSDGGLIR